MKGCLNYCQQSLQPGNYSILIGKALIEADLKSVMLGIRSDIMTEATPDQGHEYTLEII